VTVHTFNSPARSDWSVSQTRLLLSLASIIGLIIGFFATTALISVPERPPPREEIALARSELRSILPGQPLSSGRSGLVSAVAGHPPGHVISTVPRNLPKGEYAIEMVLEMSPRLARNDASCIMDLLAGEKMIANRLISPASSSESIKFRSPASNGSTTFMARLFCDGRGDVRVLEVQFIKNPDSPPSVIYQR
jgi:hypothetical protein